MAPTTAVDRASRPAAATFCPLQPSSQPPSIATFPKAAASPTANPITAPLDLRLGRTLRSSRTRS